MNLYAYANNDPMNMTDPTGMSGCILSYHWRYRNDEAATGVDTSMALLDAAIAVGLVPDPGVIPATAETSPTSTTGE